MSSSLQITAAVCRQRRNGDETTAIRSTMRAVNTRWLTVKNWCNQRHAGKPQSAKDLCLVHHKGWRLPGREHSPASMP